MGTQLGILSIFNRRNGYGDCVDRIPGHPHSIDTLCNIPSHYPNAQSTILTGSSDGLLRAVQILPTKLVGVVADHGEFPIERIAVDRGGEGRWVASAGHEEVLKLTDLKDVFEDEGGDEDEDEDEDEQKDVGEDEDKNNEAEGQDNLKQDSGGDSEPEPEAGVEEVNQDSSDDEGVAERGKRKRNKDKDPLQASKKTKARNEMDADGSFFADL